MGPKFRIALSVLLLAGFCAATTLKHSGPVDLADNPIDPFISFARARVFMFVRSDCPITNRYAPELQRIAQEFKHRQIEFWLVYPDPSESPQTIENHIAQYRFPGTPVRDPQHQLVRRAHVTVAPEAAVFDSNGHLMYHGRIDDQYVDIGKSRPAPQTRDLENAISAVLEGRAIPRPETRAIGCSLADVE